MAELLHYSYVHREDSVLQSNQVYQQLIQMKRRKVKLEGQT